MIDEKKFISRLVMLIGDSGNRPFERKTGVSEVNIRKYIKGTALPTLKNLAKIAEANNVTIAWRIGEGEQANRSPTTQQNFPNPSMQEVVLWINEQDDGINYWEVVKAKLAIDVPEFKEWLQKMREKNSTSENKKSTLYEK